jgi:hypothetical protein
MEGVDTASKNTGKSTKNLHLQQRRHESLLCRDEAWFRVPYWRKHLGHVFISDELLLTLPALRMFIPIKSEGCSTARQSEPCGQLTVHQQGTHTIGWDNMRPRARAVAGWDPHSSM